MRFIFFFLLFTFNSIFFWGIPLYLFFLPFLNQKLGVFLYEYKYNSNVREIVNVSLIYTLVLLVIDIFHGLYANSIMKIFFLNILVVYTGVELFSFARNDKKGSGLFILLVIFFLNGLVAILQARELSFFWELPERIHILFGSDISESKYLNMGFDEFSRVKGLFLYIHKFSPAIMLSSVVFFWHAFAQKKMRILYIIVAIVTFIASVLTFSRSIIVGLIIGIFIILFKKHKRYLLLTPLIFLLIYFFILDSIQNMQSSNVFLDRYAQSNIDELSNNDSQRLSGFLLSIDNFLKNPIVGSPNQSSGGYFEKITVHNILLRLLGDYGFIGFFVYVFLLYKVFKSVSFLSSRNFKNLFIIIFSIFIIELLTHSSGFLFYDVFQFSLLMMLYGYSKNVSYA